MNDEILILNATGVMVVAIALTRVSDEVIILSSEDRKKELASKIPRTCPIVSVRAPPFVYRGTSLIKNTPPKPRALRAQDL